MMPESAALSNIEHGAGRFSTPTVAPTSRAWAHSNRDLGAGESHGRCDRHQQHGDGARIYRAQHASATTAHLPAATAVKILGRGTRRVSASAEYVAGVVSYVVVLGVLGRQHDCCVRHEKLHVSVGDG